MLSNNFEFNKKFLKEFFNEIALRSSKRKEELTIDFAGLKTIIVEFAIKYEVQDIFKQFGDNSNDSVIKWEKKTMSKTDFHIFMDEVQKGEKFKNSVNDNKSMMLSSLANFDEEPLSFLDFCQHLFSSKNSIFNPEMAQLFQDMNFPLHDYFINSSHNTYLLGNQLTGESSTQAYVNAFNKGCRCVEIDCWDGPKNTPIVTHGGTLTSKITFESVIKCINDYAFQNNPYPLTLSIENHCCIAQQDQMVEIMDKIFGDKIYKPDLNEKFSYKSPNDLKYKILLKCKGLLAITKPEVKEEGDFRIKIGKVQQSMKDDNNMENYLSEEADNFEIGFPVPVFDARFQKWNETKFTRRTEKPSLNTIVMTATPHEDISKEFSSDDQFKNGSKRIFISEGNVQMNVNIITGITGVDNNKISDMIDEFQEKIPPMVASTGVMNIPNFNNIYEEKVCKIPTRTKCFSPTNEKKNDSVGKSRTSVLLSFLVSPTNKKKRTSARDSIQLSSFGSEYSKKSSQEQIPKDSTKHSTSNISIRLHECLALFGYKIKTFERQTKAYEIASFSEKKLQSYLSKEYVNLIEVNKKSFTRVYPKGTRVDSSNYDPIPGFVCGVQFVALNFQTQDLNLGTYLAMFQQNGGITSGYVLKPDVLRNKFLDERISALTQTKQNDKIPKPRKSVMDIFSSFKSKNDSGASGYGSDQKILNPPPIAPTLELSVQIISGFQILNENGKILKESFYLEVYVKGYPNDEISNKKFVSAYQENTFHPIFDNMSLSFNFIFPELAHLVFIVYKKNSKAVAFYSIPVDCIREGYRRVPLWDFSFHEIAGSFLFCKITKKESLN